MLPRGAVGAFTTRFSFDDLLWFLICRNYNEHPIAALCIAGAVDGLNVCASTNCKCRIVLHVSTIRLFATDPLVGTER